MEPMTGPRRLCPAVLGLRYAMASGIPSLARVARLEVMSLENRHQGSARGICAELGCTRVATWLALLRLVPEARELHRVLASERRGKSGKRRG